MACQSVTFNGIQGACAINRGGIKKVYIANRSDVASVTVDPATGLITAITMNGDAKFATWEFRPGTGSFSTAADSTDTAIGNYGMTATVALQFTKAEATKRLEIQSAINADSVVIVETNYVNKTADDGEWAQYLYLGYDNPVYVDSPVMQSGTAAADLSGFTLNLVETEYEFPHFIKTGSDGVDVPALVK